MRLKFTSALWLQAAQTEDITDRCGADFTDYNFSSKQRN
jgi:hypothetical protein